MPGGCPQASSALDLLAPTVVSLIGGGGKTTLLYRLARELAAGGQAVLLTTTTRMFYPAPEEADAVYLAGEKGLDAALERLRGLVGPGRRVFVARRKEGQKVVGIEPEEVDDLAAALAGTYVLVEADGAARRPCKGYAAHEPVVPPATDLLVAVTGLDALGKPLDEEWVHRPERVAAVTGLAAGQRLSPAALALALAEGIRRGRLAQRRGRAAAWLNKVTAEGLAGGRLVVRELLRAAPVERVILGAAAEEEAVREVWPAAGCGPYGIAAVVLAAGTSSRLPDHKLLLPLGKQSVIERVVEVALAAPLDPVVVVLGHRADEVAAVLGSRPVLRVHNPYYAQGQSTSVRAGLAALPGGARAAVFFLGDQPLVGPAVVEALVAAYLRTGAWVVYPTYQGRRGNPVLFAREAFAHLAALEGDQGGRGLIDVLKERALSVPVADPGVLFDIDTPAAYELAKELWQGRGE